MTAFNISPAEMSDSETAFQADLTLSQIQHASEAIDYLLQFRLSGRMNTDNSGYLYTCYMIVASMELKRGN